MLDIRDGVARDVPAVELALSGQVGLGPFASAAGLPYTGAANV